MKKMLSLVMAITMCLSLAACSGGTTSQGESSQSPAASTPAASSSQGASSTPADAESDLAYVQDQGTLYVGITNFAPMDYKEAGSDEWIGFDADMAKAFAESLGVEAQFQVIEWDNKVMELDGKTIDVVWNGMTLTDEVLSAMECSNAYCNNAQVVILPADSAEDYPDAASRISRLRAVPPARPWPLRTALATRRWSIRPRRCSRSAPAPARPPSSTA